MKHILAIAAIIPFIACGNDAKEEKKSKASSETFRLTTEDFKASLPLRDITTETDLAEALSTTTFFSPDDFSSANVTEDDDEYAKCRVDLLDPWPISASGENFEWYANVDYAACWKFEDSKRKSGTETARSYMSLHCAGADFSSLDGKHPKEIDLDKVIKSECGSNDLHQQSFFEYTFDLVTDVDAGNGKKEKSETAGKILMAKFSEGMKPCRNSRKGDTNTESGCTSIQRSVIEKLLTNGSPYSPLHGKEVILSAKSKDVTYSISSPGSWFESGTFAVKVNSWSGDVTHNGKDQAPSFKLKNGTKVISGSITP